MTPHRPLAAALAAAAALAVAAVMPSAATASRSVPSSFYAANWDGPLTKTVSAKTRDKVFGQMASAGVESIRTNFEWAFAQPKKNGSYHFHETDILMEAANAHGLDVMPVVILAPPWARRDSATSFSPPRYVNAYAAYLTALISRYGPQGSFWVTHPLLQPRPIRNWQIWNEPHLQFQWTIPKGEDYGPGYGQLLRVSYKAIKKADPGANVILAGLANQSWDFLAHLYSTGHIHGHFDVAAIHPYTRTAHGVVVLTQRFRKVLAKHHESLKSVWITELGLPASKGHVSSKSLLQTTDTGMSKFVTETYRTLADRLLTSETATERVYWYDWASTYRGSSIFSYSGLYRWDKHQGFKKRPALAAYAKSARHYEGCTKNASGACAAAR